MKRILVYGQYCQVIEDEPCESVIIDITRQLTIREVYYADPKSLINRMIGQVK